MLMCFNILFFVFLSVYLSTLNISIVFLFWLNVLSFCNVLLVLSAIFSNCMTKKNRLCIDNTHQETREKTQQQAQQHHNNAAAIHVNLNELLIFNKSETRMENDRSNASSVSINVLINLNHDIFCDMFYIELIKHMCVEDKMCENENKKEKNTKKVQG